MRPDEIALFNLLRKERPGRTDGQHMVDYYAQQIGMPWKRMQYLLEKWSDRGWRDCGVSERTGWFTEKAPEKLP